MTTSTLQPIWAGLRWNVRLAAKMLRAAPAATVGVVVFTLVSQLSMLVAFFLPLKVVILLGSDGLPSKLPGMLAQLDRDTLIVAMSVGAALFYGVHLVSNELIKILARSGAHTLTQRSSKQPLLARQQKLASQAYKRQAQIMADATFALLAAAVLLWLYPAVAAVAMGYVAAMGVGLLVACAASPAYGERLQKQLAQWLNPLSGLGFMLVFGFLVLDHLYYSPPNVVMAIIALLLSRQAMKRLPSLIVKLVNQYKVKDKLIDLFFKHSAN
jgi:hypothetical protein